MHERQISIQSCLWPCELFCGAHPFPMIYWRVFSSYLCFIATGIVQAQTREMCVQSSQEVYDRLMISAGGYTTLPFSILSVLAINSSGEYEDAKIKSIIRLFRPDRQGNLGRLDFVKSIDAVYKQLRLLRASIANSGMNSLLLVTLHFLPSSLSYILFYYQLKSITPLRELSTAFSTSSW